jgi:hypothetical protein
MYEINMSPETEVEDFDHHKENVVGVDYKLYE